MYKYTVNKIIISNSASLFLLPTKEDADSFCANNIIENIKLPYIALPGGKTPERVFSMICETINNNETCVFPSDERLVEITSSESNFSMMKKYFKNVFQIYKKELSYEQIGLMYNKSIPQFDQIVLGCGADGHIASLFPGNINFENEASMFLSKKMDYNIRAYSTFVNDIGWRCSLSLASIITCNHVILFATGKSKRQIIKRLLNNTNTPTLPIDFLRFCKKLTVISDEDKE